MNRIDNNIINKTFHVIDTKSTYRLVALVG